MTRSRPATFFASAVPDAPPAPRRRRLLELRGHPWTPPERAILISLVAIAMGSLFVTTYSLALGDPIPRHINAAIVGDGGAHSGPVDSTELVARGKLDFHRYPSLPAALHAIDLQNVYAALNVASQRPTLYVASAAGASVARVLQTIATVDRTVRVRDTHPLSVHDPSGLNIFYLMLVTTIVGFLTVFQVRANVGELRRRRWRASASAGIRWVHRRLLGGGGCDPVLVELQQVVGGGDQSPFRPGGGSATSSELPEPAVVLDLPERRLDRPGALAVELGTGVAGQRDGPAGPGGRSVRHRHPPTGPRPHPIAGTDDRRLARTALRVLPWRGLHAALARAGPGVPSCG
jgi:hypothetical protein